MTRTILNIAGLKAAYGASEVVHGVDLTLSEGKIACLVGPSGSGKSTILRAIAGFEQPTAGTIHVGQTLVSAKGVSVPPDARRIGVVMQDYALFPHLTVAQNIAFGLNHLAKAEIKTRVDRLVATVDLDALTQRYPHELSGGQQQRVALARALAREPQLLLLDEPFSNLDPQLSRRMLRELQRLLKTLGVTVLIVTHDQDEAFDVADVMGVMDQGHLLQWGEPRALYAHPRCRQVAEFLGACSLLPLVAQGAGARTALGDVAAPLPSGDGTPYCLVVRPDEVVVDASAATKGTVLATQFRGTHVIYQVQLPEGIEVQVFATGLSAPLAAGAAIGLRLALQGEPKIVLG